MVRYEERCARSVECTKRTAIVTRLNECTDVDCDTSVRHIWFHVDTDVMCASVHVADNVQIC